MCDRETEVCSLENSISLYELLEQPLIRFRRYRKVAPNADDHGGRPEITVLLLRTNLPLNRCYKFSYRDLTVTRRFVLKGGKKSAKKGTTGVWLHSFFQGRCRSNDIQP